MAPLKKLLHQINHRVVAPLSVNSHFNSVVNQAMDVYLTGKYHDRCTFQRVTPELKHSDECN